MLLDKNNPAELERYNEFVRNSKHGKFYQDIRWAKVKSNWDPEYFYIERDGEIVAALSTLSINDSLTNKRLMLATRGPVCDIYDRDLVIELFDEVKAYAAENNVFLVRIDPEIEKDEKLYELYEDTDYPIQKERYKLTQYPMSLMLDINGRTSEEMLMDLPSKTRRDVRKAIRNEVEIFEGKREDMATFAELTKDMSENKDLGYRGQEYFERLYDAFGEDVRVIFAKHEDTILACSLMLLYGNTGIYLYGADPIHESLEQSALLRFNEIEYCCNNGYEFYDTGGIFSTDMEDGLYRFKRKWTEDNVIEWVGTFDIVLDEEVYEIYLEDNKARFERNHG